jgi:hypothetical protein
MNFGYLRADGESYYGAHLRGNGYGGMIDWHGGNMAANINVPFTGPAGPMNLGPDNLPSLADLDPFVNPLINGGFIEANGTAQGGIVRLTAGGNEQANSLGTDYDYTGYGFQASGTAPGNAPTLTTFNLNASGAAFNLGSIRTADWSNGANGGSHGSITLMGTQLVGISDTSRMNGAAVNSGLSGFYAGAQSNGGTIQLMVNP